MGTTIEAVKKKYNKTGNVRKALNVVALWAPMTTSVPDAITEAGGVLKELSDEWVPMGTFTTDGATISTDVTVDDVEALGYAEPVRSDLTKASKTVKLSVFELATKGMQELIYGVDLSQVKANKTTGEVVFDESLLPVMREVRLLVISADGPVDDEWLMGWCFPRVKLSSFPEIGLKASDPISGELEFKTFSDETLGTSARHYLGGSGMIRHRDITGFTVAV